METDNNQDPTYVVGRSPEETERLKDQERFYGPITKRMLTDAGMHEGMHVLDVGCGAGDVALLAAELVGETGRVTAIDVNPDILVATRQRVAALGVNHIDFVEGDVRTHEFDDQFGKTRGPGEHPLEDRDDDFGRDHAHDGNHDRKDHRLEREVNGPKREFRECFCCHARRAYLKPP